MTAPDGPHADDVTRVGVSEVTATRDRDAPRDPLLARAEDAIDLPLDERPAAFDGLNRALVAELQQLEEA